MRQEKCKILLQTFADTLRCFLNVLALQIVCFAALCFQHCLYGFLGIWEEFFLANGNSKERHTFESLASEPAFLLSGGSHDQLFEDWHNCIVVPREIFFN